MPSCTKTKCTPKYYCQCSGVVQLSLLNIMHIKAYQRPTYETCTFKMSVGYEPITKRGHLSHTMALSLSWKFLGFYEQSTKSFYAVMWCVIGCGAKEHPCWQRAMVYHCHCRLGNKVKCISLNNSNKTGLQEPMKYMSFAMPCRSANTAEVTCTNRDNLHARDDHRATRYPVEVDKNHVPSGQS